MASPVRPRSPAVPPVMADRLRLPAMFRALRHRNYRLFFIGQLISLTGTWMQQVAQGWLVLRLTDSPALLGLVAAANSLPVILLSLPAGAIIDRVPRRNLLVVTQVVALLLALLLAVLTLSNLVQVWHILLLALLLGCVNAFDAPARQSFTVEMSGREDLLNAIALNSSIFNGARTIGPAVAGVVVALIGEGPAFLVNALSFAAVIAGLLMMRLPPFTPPVGRRGSQLREGLVYIAREPVIRSLLLLAGAISFFGFTYIPLLPVFARDVLDAGASGLGMLSAASGLGSLTGALALAQFGERIPRGRVVTGAMIAHPLLMISFSMAQQLPLAMLLLMLTGFAGVMAMALTNTLIQATVRDDVRGRVMSVFTLLLMGLSPLGGMLAGIVAQFVGDTPLIVACSAGVGWLMVLTVLLLSPHVRKL